MPNKRRDNPNGGLTIVAAPGFVKVAEEVKLLIENKEKEKAEKLENPDERKEAEKNSGVDLVIPKFAKRESGEPYCQLSKEHIGGHDCVIITSGPANWQRLGELQLILSYLVGRRARRIAIIFGYFPLGRSDKDEGELELALPPMLVRQWQAATNGTLDRIIACDLHSPQIVMAGWSGLITEVSMARKVLNQAVADAKELGYNKIVVHFPDDGAAKRYEQAYLNVKKETGIPMYWTEGSKRRTDSGHCELGPITGDTEKLPEALAIIMDDEAATMSTAIKWAKSLKENYLAQEVWGSIVHGVLCGEGKTILAKPECPITRLYCSDTIPFYDRSDLAHYFEKGKVRIVSWICELANIIYHHHWDESIREMR